MDEDLIVVLLSVVFVLVVFVLVVVVVMVAVVVMSMILGRSQDCRMSSPFVTAHQYRATSPDCRRYQASLYSNGRELGWSGYISRACGFSPVYVQKKVADLLAVTKKQVNSASLEAAYEFAYMAFSGASYRLDESKNPIDVVGGLTDDIADLIGVVLRAIPKCIYVR